MSDTEFQCIADSQPELQIRPAVRQQHMQLMTQLASSPEVRRSSAGKRAAIVTAGVLVLSAGGVSVAAAFGAFSTPTNRNVAHCYATADLHDPTNHTDFAIATPLDPAIKSGDAAGEALDACRGDWSQGRFGSTNPKVKNPDLSGTKHPVPALAACVLKSGEVGVFPGTDNVCGQLGLTIADLG